MFSSMKPLHEEHGGGMSKWESGAESLWVRTARDKGQFDDVRFSEAHLYEGARSRRALAMQ